MGDFNIIFFLDRENIIEEKIEEKFFKSCQINPSDVKKFYEFYVICSLQQIAQTPTYTAQKMKIYIKGFFSKCKQIRRKMRIW